MKKPYLNLLILIIVVIDFVFMFNFINIKTKYAAGSIDNPVKDRLQLIKEKGVLTIASSNDQPFAFIDPITNTPAGLDVEIVNEIASRLGIKKVELVIIPFQNFLTELDVNPNIDFIADGIYITDERKKYVSFINPWYKQSEALVIPKFSPITGISDLKNSVIGAQLGTIYLDLALKWKERGLIKDVKVYTNQPDLLYAVNNGIVDAIVTDSLVVSYLLPKDQNLYLKIMYPYKPEFFGFISPVLRKTDVSLGNAINEKIDEIRNDGTLNLILKKYNATPVMSMKNFDLFI